MHLIPKKSLGQHFLNSPTVLAKIISAANIQPNETILEIGPGTGILTEELLKKETNITAIEKDDRAYELLKQKYFTQISNKKLNLIHGDVLNINYNQLNLSEGNYALVANIPYYITGAILELFLEYGPRPNRMILLVQKEVAERIVAKDGKESILSISVKAFGTPRIVSNVPKGAFSPPPTVESAILEINNINSGLLLTKNSNFDTKMFFKIIKTAFAHKRKYAIRNLEAIFDSNNIRNAWKNTGLAENIRSEDISVEKWIEVAQEILNSVHK